MSPEPDVAVSPKQVETTPKGTDEAQPSTCSEHSRQSVPDEMLKVVQLQQVNILSLMQVVGLSFLMANVQQNVPQTAARLVHNNQIVNLQVRRSTASDESEQRDETPGNQEQVIQRKELSNRKDEQTRDQNSKKDEFCSNQEQVIQSNRLSDKKDMKGIDDDKNRAEIPGSQDQLIQKKWQRKNKDKKACYQKNERNELKQVTKGKWVGDQKDKKSKKNKGDELSGNQEQAIKSRRLGNEKDKQTNGSNNKSLVTPGNNEHVTLSKCLCHKKNEKNRKKNKDKTPDGIQQVIKSNTEKQKSSDKESDSQVTSVYDNISTILRFTVRQVGIALYSVHNDLINLLTSGHVILHHINRLCSLESLPRKLLVLH
ncbi:RING finger protein PFF0165c-like [Erpetoichthys calabaricus]|uniref:RING finger protein PFF0165c-like n=1 Tax=Erpetoichthys calabaricus TaxID=27687 RepID=UPI0022345BEC|nr:RING finger protein PFF0165c-like [Erpetoichthys calabaricus]